MAVEQLSALGSGIFAISLAVMNDIALELSRAGSEDELCRLAICLGLERLGFDRLGLWLLDRDDPAYCVGTYGTDEAGAIRDEHGRRFARDPWPEEDPYVRGCPLRFLPDSDCKDELGRAVGRADRAVALLWDGEKAIGELAVDNLLTRRAIDGGALDLLVMYARTIGHLLRKARAEEELRLQASTDLLTGVMNRRVTLMFLDKQMGLAARKGERLSVAYVDLDGLKAVNDGFGHAEGDAYIAAATGLLTESVRASDCVGRLGGDEFLVIFPDCPEASAATVMRRISRAALERSAAEGKGYAYSLSWGVAALDELGRAGLASNAAALVELADKRMYEDKISRGADRR